MSVMSGKSANTANTGKQANAPVYDGAAMNSLFGDDDIAPAGEAAPKDKLVDPLAMLAAGVKNTKSEDSAASGQAESAF